MKKRICSILLVLVLMIGCTSFTTGVYADSDLYGEEALTHMKNLGILPYSLEGDEPVTRADFAQAVYILAGKNVILPFEQLYYDVAGNDNYSNAVMYCSKNGYMVGSDGMFRPDDTITYIEAMTVMARVLNYTEYAKNNGDYTLGYYTTAKNIGLLNNTGIVSSGDSMNVNSCAAMLYNALRISVNNLASINPIYHIYQTSDKIFAYEALGLNYASGIMTSNGYVDVSGKELTGENLVIIGGQKYTSRLLDDSFRKYIGQEVSVFYDDDTNIVSIAPTGKSKVITVDKDNFGRKSGNTVQYYVNDKLMKAAISDKAIYFKNGKVVMDYKSTGFDTAEYADLNLVDGDGDGDFECVFVNIYNTFVVSNVTSDGVMRSSDNKHVLDLSDENPKDIFVYNADGEQKSVEYIRPDCTVSVVEGDNFIYVIYTDYTITGTVQEKDEYKIIINDLVVDVANSTTEKLKDISLGNQATVYFDFAGRLVYARKAALVNGTGLYGFLVDGVYENDFDKSIKLKIFTNSEEMKIYTVSNSFKIDDTKYNLNSLSGLPSEFYSDGSLRNTMILYDVNSEQKITGITFPKTTLGIDEDGFIQTTSEQRAYRLSNGALTNITAQSDGTYFSGKEFLNSGTEIFVVPDDLNEEDKFAIVSMSDIPVSTNFIWDTYHLSKYNGFVDIAVVYSDYAAVSYDTTLSVVLSVSQALDSDGNEVVAIKHFSNNNVLTSYAPEDFKISEYKFDSTGAKTLTNISINTLKPGDGVRLTVGKNGSIRQGERIYEYNASENAFKGSSKGGAYATHSLYLASGYVAYNDKTMFRLSDTKENAVITSGDIFDLIGAVYSSAKIMIVEESAKGVSVRTGTSSDVEIGDYMIYQSRSGIAAYVVVYKDK